MLLLFGVSELLGYAREHARSRAGEPVERRLHGAVRRPRPHADSGDRP
jgi:hypothetical protein